MENLGKFLRLWSKAGGTDCAKYPSLLTELGSLLDLPLPEPAGDDTRHHA